MPLTLTQIRIATLVASAKFPPYVTQLQYELNIAYSQLAKVINTMEKLGYLRTKTRGRARFVHPTRKTKRLCVAGVEKIIQEFDGI